MYKKKRSYQEHPCGGGGISRREFLTKTGMAGAGLMLGGLLAGRAFSAMRPSANSLVALTDISTYEQSAIKAALAAMLDDLGGLGDIIGSGDSVGIKINLTGGNGAAVDYQNESGLPPGETIWTHPAVLQAIGELVIDAGAGNVYFLEAIYDQESYNNWGYKDVSDYLGTTFIDLNGKSPYADYAIRSVGQDHLIYENFTQNGILNDIDCLISLAKSKRHVSAGVTHGIKNLVGNLPIPSGLYNDGQGHRAGIHNNTTDFDGNSYSNLCRTILDLHNASPVKLVINDAIKTVLGGEGPWVNITPAVYNTLIASKDPVAADAIATQIMGFDPTAADLTDPFPESLNYLNAASSMGMGNYHPDNIDLVQSTPVGLNSTAVNEPKFHCYPNPVEREATFVFTNRSSGTVTIDLYSLDGRKVRTIARQVFPMGVHKVRWNDTSGLATGTYLAMLRAGSDSQSFKVVVSK
jgi:uncharacterized protein (DUF362 family)